MRIEVRFVGPTLLNICYVSINGQIQEYHLNQRSAFSSAIEIARETKKIQEEPKEILLTTYSKEGRVTFSRDCTLDEMITKGTHP